MAEAKIEYIDIPDACPPSDKSDDGRFTRVCQPPRETIDRSSAILAYIRPRSNTLVDPARLEAAREQLTRFMQARACSKVNSEAAEDQGQKRLVELFTERSKGFSAGSITRPARRDLHRPPPDFNDPRLRRLESLALLGPHQATSSDEASESSGLRRSIGQAELEWLSAEERGYKARLAADGGQGKVHQRSSPRVISPKGCRNRVTP